MTWHFSTAATKCLRLPAFLAFSIAPIAVQAQPHCFTDVDFEDAVVTDGQDVIFTKEYVPVNVIPRLGGNGHVIFTGYRYDLRAPTILSPDGLGQFQIYSECLLLRSEWYEVTDRIDGGIDEYRLRYSFTVPVNAPSGDYYVSILNGSCETGIVPVAPPDCEAKGEAHNVTVPTSYIVTVIDGLKIDGNAEPAGNHPAEMRFTFVSFSGVPSIEGNVATALVTNSGAYPGGVSGAGHLTNADGTIHEMQLPVFTGREDLMLFAECEEEAVAFPAIVAARRFEQCTQWLEGGRFSDHFQYTMAGVEFDDTPGGGIFGVFAGLAAGGFACYVNPINNYGTAAGVFVSIGVGFYVRKLVNDAILDTDDYLGDFTRSVLFDWGSNWLSGGNQGNQTMGGGPSMGYPG